MYRVSVHPPHSYVIVVRRKTCFEPVRKSKTYNNITFTYDDVHHVMCTGVVVYERDFIIIVVLRLKTAIQVINRKTIAKPVYSACTRKPKSSYALRADAPFQEWKLYLTNGIRRPFISHRLMIKLTPEAWSILDPETLLPGSQCMQISIIWAKSFCSVLEDRSDFLTRSRRYAFSAGGFWRNSLAQVKSHAKPGLGRRRTGCTSIIRDW